MFGKSFDVVCRPGDDSMVAPISEAYCISDRDGPWQLYIVLKISEVSSRNIKIVREQDGVLQSTAQTLNLLHFSNVHNKYLLYNA